MQPFATWSSPFVCASSPWAESRPSLSKAFLAGHAEFLLELPQLRGSHVIAVHSGPQGALANVSSVQGLGPRPSSRPLSSLPATALLPSPLHQDPPEVILVPPLLFPLQGPPLACGGGSCTTSRPAPHWCLLGDPVGPIFSPLIVPPPVPALVS